MFRFLALERVFDIMGCFNLNFFVQTEDRELNCTCQIIISL